MKKLKQSTINSYNLKQLVNHLERYQNYHFDIAPYRFLIDSSAYCEVFEYCVAGVEYYHLGKFSKNEFIDILEDIYRGL